jgi:hypothetical protein
MRIFAAIILVASFASLRADQTAASLSDEHVQAAINAATDGEIVNLPAGSATWDANVTFTNKGISIVGAGIGSTIITAGAANGQALVIHSCGVKNVSASTISWVGSGVANGTISIGGNSETNTNFRFHHMAFTVGTAGASGRGIVVQGKNDGGVIDHCTFTNPYNTSGQAVTIYGDAGYNLVPGNTAASFPAGTAWTRGLTLGTSEMVFIEDNTINFTYQNDAAIEGYQGARYVARHNTIYNAQVGFHGLDSSVSGSHSWEVYENDMIWQTSPSTHKTLVDTRSGTGVIYNNRCTSAGSYVSSWIVQLISYRSAGDSISYNYALRSTHTGGNNTATLTDAAKTWTVNQYAVAKEPTTLYNFTDGSIGTVISNTSNTITVALTGGTDNDFDTGDSYGLASQQGGMQQGINPYDGNEAVTNGSGTHNGSSNASVLTDTGKAWTVSQFVSPIQHTVWNRTDGSYGRITANTATTVTAKLVGGTEADWDASDTYVITYGYPGLEQVGTTGPTTLGPTNSTITKSPVYIWNNLYTGPDGTNVDASVFPGVPTSAALTALNIARPHPQDAIVLNRDWFMSAKPGYTPYTYPHPLTGGADATAPELTACAVAVAGTTITLSFDEAVTRNSGTPTVSLSGGACTLTYASGSGGSSHIYAASRVIYSGETGTLSAAPGSNGWEDASGNDFAAVVNDPLVNNSTAVSGGGSTTFGAGAGSVASGAGAGSVSFQ